MELENTRDLINRGSGMYSIGNYTAAREYFEKALAEDPGCAEAYVDIAQTYIMEDNYAQARENLKNAILVNKKEAAAYFHLANVEMLEENRSLAREYYAKALNYGFDSAEIYRNLAADAEERGDYSEALNYYDKILAKDKMDAYSKIRKVYIFIMQGKYPEALKSSESLLETSPDLSVSYQLKFAVLCDMERYDDAEKVLDRALEMFPGDADFEFDRATLQGIRGNYDKAVEMLDKMELTDENEEIILIKKARMLLAELKVNEATALLEPLYAKTFSSEAAYLLSTVFMSQKDFAKAAQYAQELVDKAEYDDFYYSGVYTKAAALLRSGAPESTQALRDANKIFRSACVKNPEQIQYYLYRAVCHKELKEFDESLDMLEFIIKAAPNFAEAYYLRSLVYAELGQTDKAEEDRKKSVELDPNVAELLGS